MINPWLKTTMSDQDLIDALYAAALSRQPSAVERAAILTAVLERGASSREEV